MSCDNKDTELTKKESMFLAQLSDIVSRLHLGDIKNLSAAGMAMVILEYNGFVEPWQNDFLRKYFG